jgi:threonyl-tRNA synthetase
MTLQTMMPLLMPALRGATRSPVLRAAGPRLLSAKAGEQGASPADSKAARGAHFDGKYLLPHPAWSEAELSGVSPQWPEPGNIRETLARAAIRTIRFNFDVLTGFKFRPTEQAWLSRMIFLETIAAVPGFCGAAIRHLRSLRLMQRDRGWINCLLSEAENERMHLLSFLELRQPGPIMRMMVFLSQGIFWNFYFVMFLLSPRFAFALVSNLEVEAVKTYTHCLEEIDHGSLQHWQGRAAPEIARNYWNLGEQATLRDMIRHIRADEAHHRKVNHELSTLDPYKQANPFVEDPDHARL